MTEKIVKTPEEWKEQLNPEPESNFVSDEKSFSPQHTQL